MLTNNKKTLAIAISAIVIATGASSIQAAGFQLKEQSAEGQGNSFAGQTAKAVDASTIFFNPAGMALLEGNQVQGNLSFIAPTADYKHTSNSGPTPFSDFTNIDGGVSAFVPSAYAVWDYSDDVKLGLSVNVPFGLSTEYDEDWVGAEYNVLSEITSINIASSISYKVNDQFSIGGNVQVQKTTGTITSMKTLSATSATLATLEADDVGFGYGLGMLYQYSDKGRIGFNYRSEIKHKLEGDLSIPGAGAQFDAHADFTTPASASIGIYHDLNEKWTLLADVSWTDWSVFESLDVINDAGTTVSSTTYNWSDNVFVAVGANYQYSDKLQLKFGVAYDEGAANDEDRTAGIPDASRIWASVGASYKLNKQTTLSMGYSHINADSASISETASVASGKSSSYAGSFDSSVNILTLGINYQF